MLVSQGVAASAEVMAWRIRRTCSSWDNLRHAAISASLGFAEDVTERNKACCSGVTVAAALMEKFLPKNADITQRIPGLGFRGSIRGLGAPPLFLPRLFLRFISPFRHPPPLGDDGLGSAIVFDAQWRPVDMGDHRRMEGANLFRREARLPVADGARDKASPVENLINRHVRNWPYHAASLSHGLTTGTRALSNSRVSRVTAVRPCCNAVAAIIGSGCE